MLKYAGLCVCIKNRISVTLVEMADSVLLLRYALAALGSFVGCLGYV